MKDSTKIKKQSEKISKLEKRNKELKILCEKLTQKERAIKEMLNQIIKYVNKDIHKDEN